MSGLEIERKFLVKKGDAYKSAAFSHSHIKQGYIPADGATVRIRVRDDKADQLLKLCKGGLIDKTRYLVKSGKHTFEVDEFYGDNAGLVMAEVELSDEAEAFDAPAFIGKEVTGDRRFYNSHLLTNPFCRWRDTLPTEYR